jgi:phosphate transport system substrate-binding protein
MAIPYAPLFLSLALAGAAPEAPQLRPYTKHADLQGLHAVGSDTLAGVISYWSEAFSRHYPGLKVADDSRGSATAPPALIEGRANLAPMSRPMKREELEAFKARKGYAPTEVIVGLDAIAIFVPKENPVTALSMEQLEGIFGREPRKGPQVVTWGQLGLGGAWAAMPVKPFGRNSKSGTFSYFQEHVLGGGTFLETVRPQEDSLTLAFAVTGEPGGIGYTGLGHLGDTGDSLRALPISPRSGAPAVAPNLATILDGTYPVSRSLYIYVDRAPGKPLPRIVLEFLRFALSQEGQKILADQGFIPLDGTKAEAELAKIQ